MVFYYIVCEQVELRRLSSKIWKNIEYSEYCSVGLGLNLLNQLGAYMVLLFVEAYRIDYKF